MPLEFTYNDGSPVTTSADYKLRAVNKMLDAIGEPSVTALDTGGSSIVTDAERVLDEVITEILSQGWHDNTEKEAVLNFSSVELTVTVSEAFPIGQLIRQATTLARGYTAENYSLAATSLYVCPLEDSPDFDGSNAIEAITQYGETLSGYGAATVSDVTDHEDDGGVIVLPRDVLGFKTRAADAGKPYAIRYPGKLYDMTKPYQGELFTAPVEVEMIRLLALEELTEKLRLYIESFASVKFQRRKKRGQVDDSMLLQELQSARIRAIQEDGDHKRVNVLTTSDAYNIKGNRNIING